MLPLIWAYLRNLCGTKKAHCVCNGSPRMKDTVNLAHTYTPTLEQPGARLFWALTALQNYTVYGANATNASSYAPPPVAPLYITIVKAYRDWWEKVKKRPPTPHAFLIPVKHALQWRPESPYLLAKMIDGILKSNTFVPTTHEPYLYSATIDGHNFFLHQVDNFTVSAPN